MFIFLLFACSDNDKNVKKELTVADPNQPVFALVYIAHEKNYFSEFGLKINFENFTSGRNALTSIIQKTSDVALVYETPVVHEVMKKTPLRILSSLHSSEFNTALVLRRDSNVKGIKGIKGKSIGVPLRTNAEFFLNVLLKNNDIRISEINIVDIKPENANDLIVGGSIDGTAIWNPHLYQIKKNMLNHDVDTFYSHLYTEMSMLVSLNDVILKKKAEIKSFISALQKAKIFLQQYPDEALKIVIQRLQSSHSKQNVIGTWESVHIELNLSNALIGLLNMEAQWIREKNNNMIPLPDFTNYVDSTFLEEVAPGSVTIFKERL